jgi:hypothetical protein
MAEREVCFFRLRFKGTAAFWLVLLQVAMGD